MKLFRQKITQSAKRVWTRFCDFLDARADRHVNAWSMALQYKRRYTNPEEAKAFRTPVEEIKLARADRRVS